LREKQGIAASGSDSQGGCLTTKSPLNNKKPAAQCAENLGIAASGSDSQGGCLTKNNPATLCDESPGIAASGSDSQGGLNKEQPCHALRGIRVFCFFALLSKLRSSQQKTLCQPFG
jgi:hypothetical protein